MATPNQDQQQNKKLNVQKTEPTPKEIRKDEKIRTSYGDKPMDKEETRDIGHVQTIGQYNDYEDVDMESTQEIDSSRRDMSQSVGGRRGGGSPPKKKKAESSS